VTIPIPPLAKQEEFAARVGEVCAMQAVQAASRVGVDYLFQALLYRAFNGEL
jgi:hypothetical protein